MTKQIENYIKENLKGEARQYALEFVAFLRKNDIDFYKDNCECWKDKLYYWLKFKNECVAFIAVKDPDEPYNLWTVWSDDCKAYENDITDEEIKKLRISILIFADIADRVTVANEKPYSGKLLTAFAAVRSALIIRPQRKCLF